MIFGSEKKKRRKKVLSVKNQFMPQVRREVEVATLTFKPFCKYEVVFSV